MATQTIDRDSLDAVVCGIFQRLGLDAGVTYPAEPADYLHDCVLVPVDHDDPTHGYVEPLEAYEQVHFASSILIPAVVAAIENPLNVDLGPVKSALAKARKEIVKLRAGRIQSKPRAAA